MLGWGLASSWGGVDWDLGALFYLLLLLWGFTEGLHTEGNSEGNTEGFFDFSVWYFVWLWGFHMLKRVSITKLALVVAGQLDNISDLPRCVFVKCLFGQ